MVGPSGERGVIIRFWRGLSRGARALLIIQLATLCTYLVLFSSGLRTLVPEEVDTALILIADAGAAFACLHAAGSLEGRSHARGWRWLAAANFAYVLGNLGWFVPSLAAATQDGLSLLDVPYFVFYPCVFLAVMSWPRPVQSGARRVISWLDAMVVPVGAGMAVWFGLAQATATSFPANPGGEQGALLYPFADLVLLFCVALLTRDPPDAHAGLAAKLIALSLLLTTFGDIGLALSTLNKSRGQVDWPDLVYVTASGLITLAALTFRSEAAEGSPIWNRLRPSLSRLPGLSLIFPVTCAGLGFLFLTYDAIAALDLRAAGLATGASSLLLLGVVRAVLADRDSDSDASKISQTLDELRQSKASAEAARTNAEQALQEKSQFFAVMGHEIRTPLNAVIGMAQVLLTTPLSGAQRESAEVIRQGGDALLAVVNDLLDFSKIEAGRLEIEKAPFNPGRAIERIVLLMRPTASVRSLSINLNLRRLPPLALGDEARLGQILLNLLSNAIKFSQKGEILVEASMREPASGRELVVSVKDQGVGIAPAKISELFQPFNQLSPGRARNYGGTGLGLVICKRLAEMMGGDVAIESVVGVGSTFTFRVRLDPAPKVETMPLPPLPPGFLINAAQRGSLKVLVVEDNLVNQQVARALVEILGHQVEMSPDGLDALARCASKAFDVILMDLMMPGMDGIEATGRLRETENGRRAFIVAVTAAATVEDKQRCLAAGMDAFLPKPFTLETLAAVFSRLPSTSARAN